jgi:hypothetical protein
LRDNIQNGRRIGIGGDRVDLQHQAWGLRLTLATRLDAALSTDADAELGRAGMAPGQHIILLKFAGKAFADLSFTLATSLNW